MGCAKEVKNSALEISVKGRVIPCDEVPSNDIKALETAFSHYIHKYESIPYIELGTRMRFHTFSEAEDKALNGADYVLTFEGEMKYTQGEAICLDLQKGEAIWFLPQNPKAAFSSDLEDYQPGQCYRGIVFLWKQSYYLCVIRSDAL